jgi:hypothetical protein
VVPCPADITGSGEVNMLDLQPIILEEWGHTGPNWADVNDDSVINIDDLLAVIYSWGPCP